MFNVIQRFKRAHRGSERAIAKFLTTEAALLKHNAKLDAVVTDLNDELFRIEELRTAAINRRAENTGIANRIGEIVRGNGEVSAAS